MKGRDKELISARDRKLYERYYYWTEVQRLRFDDTLHILSTQEFFISESRIMQIIRKLIGEGYEMEKRQETETSRLLRLQRRPTETETCGRTAVTVSRIVSVTTQL